LQAINPKAYVVNTTLFSGFVLFAESYTLEVAAKFLIVNVIWLSIHFLWLWVGASIKAMNLSDGTQRIINIGMALAMLGVVALASFTALSGG
jgi:threonine/homoserine/homoserine lactone efflux protein